VFNELKVILKEVVMVLSCHSAVGIEGKHILWIYGVSAEI
jgi:hypothetical protein